MALVGKAVLRRRDRDGHAANGIDCLSGLIALRAVAVAMGVVIVRTVIVAAAATALALMPV